MDVTKAASGFVAGWDSPHNQSRDAYGRAWHVQPLDARVYSTYSHTMTLTARTTARFVHATEHVS